LLSIEARQGRGGRCRTSVRDSQPVHALKSHCIVTAIGSQTSESLTGANMLKCCSVQRHQHRRRHRAAARRQLATSADSHSCVQHAFHPFLLASTSTKIDAAAPAEVPQQGLRQRWQRRHCCRARCSSGHDSNRHALDCLYFSSFPLTASSNARFAGSSQGNSSRGHALVATLVRRCAAAACEISWVTVHLRRWVWQSRDSNISDEGCLDQKRPCINQGS